MLLTRVRFPVCALLFFFRFLKMSQNIFNKNSNALLNCNDIEMKEPNANQQAPNCIFNIERRQFKCNIDPNILATNLLNHLNEELMQKKSKDK